MYRYQSLASSIHYHCPKDWLRICPPRSPSCSRLKSITLGHRAAHSSARNNWKRRRSNSSMPKECLKVILVFLCLSLSRCPSDIISAIEHAEDSVYQASIFRLGVHKRIPHEATNNELLWDRPEPTNEVCLVNIVQSMHLIQVPKYITNLLYNGTCAIGIHTVYI